MATVNTTALNAGTLKTKLQTYYGYAGGNQEAYQAVDAAVKVLIDVGIITGVTAADVDAQHKALANPVRQS